MRAPILSLLVLAAFAAAPLPLLASGEDNLGSQRFDQNRADKYDQSNFTNRRRRRTETAAARVVIAQAPHDLGKAIYSGKYPFQKRKLTAPNIAEKANRLFTLKNILPASERRKIDPRSLAPQLTDREMNALEYYLGVRFAMFLAVSPSWAKEEPPIKIAYSR